MPTNSSKAPPGSNNEARLAALERWMASVDQKLGIAAQQAAAALQIGPQQRGATAGSVLGAGKTAFDAGGLVNVMSTIVNGGTQTGGPIVGVAGPPTGLSGVGGEVVLTTATFTLPRQETVMLLAICSNYVLCTVAFVTAHPLYFQVDGTDNVTAYGFAPVWANPGNAETRAMSSTILLVTTLGLGSHTVKVIWNSEEGNKDTIHNANNPLFVFQLGS